MIGSFAFSESRNVADDLAAVFVDLSWAKQGSRQARVVTSSAMRTALKDRQIDLVADNMLTVEAALTYGVFIAMRTRGVLLLTGDPSVWDPKWGALVETNRRSRPTDREPARIPRPGGHHA